METPAVNPKLDAAYVQYSTSPVTCPEQKEAKFDLYLHRVGQGSANANQTVPVAPTTNLSWGLIAVSDWGIREGNTSASKLIGHAQGMHVQCGRDKVLYYLSINIVFVDGSFAGSTLEVRGSSDNFSTGQWAVVGGTGQFTLAQGIVTLQPAPNDGGVTVSEMNIHIFYRQIN